MHKQLGLALGVLVLSCGSSSDGNSGTNVPPGTTAAESKLVTGLLLREVSIYQALKTPLMIAFETGPPNVPIVQSRPAALRVFVEPTEDWVPREIVARLEMETVSGQMFPVQELRGFIDGVSVEEDFATTFNFTIPPEQMTADVGYSVTLLEADPTVEHPGIDNFAHWPPDVAKSLIPTENAGGPLEVVIVPIRYDADGSGRLPDLGEDQLTRIRDAFMAMYPVPDVVISIRSNPLPFGLAVEPSGGGWGELLNRVLVQRGTDGVPPNVYYYGMFNPTDSIFAFCGRGCIGGLSPLVDEDAAFLRGSIGLGYGGNFAGANSTSTVVHEIGHAHGREHAPCMLGGQQSDRNYPHPNAEIGGWGFNIVSNELVSPGNVRDIMGYCQPYWVSDYTYTALFRRTQFVNSVAQVIRPDGAPTAYRMFSADADGRLRGGDALPLDAAPIGEPRSFELVDAAGAPAGSLRGNFYAYDHLPGGIVLVAEKDLAIPAIEYTGKVVAF